MISKEEFELHKSIVDWMREAGVPFMESIAILSYAIQTDRSICESYIKLGENIYNNTDKRRGKTNWISVEDMFPEKDIPVLCFYSDQYIDVMEYWYDDEETGKPNFFRPPAPPVDSVTHWMPLPEPPKEEEK